MYAFKLFNFQITVLLYSRISFLPPSLKKKKAILELFIFLLSA